MTIRLRLLVTALLAVCLVAASPQRSASAVEQPASTSWVVVRQGKTTLSPAGSKVVLKRQPFELGFTLPAESPLARVHVSSSAEVYDAAVAGKPIDQHFRSGLGMVEGVFNDAREMFVHEPGEEGFHYWYYEREGDHRFDFDGVVKSSTGIVARRTIATLTQNRVPHRVAEYPGTDVYVVALTGQPPREQHQALHLVFSEPPVARAPYAGGTTPKAGNVPTPTRVCPDAPSPRQTKYVPPDYPPIAVSARVEGLVTLDLTIGLDGKVTDAKVVKSIPLLDSRAVAAARQWEFTPPLAGGRPRPLITTVVVPFFREESPGAPARLARVSRGSVTGDGYDNSYFGIRLRPPADWKAVPDSDLVRRDDGVGKALQAMAGRPLELFPAFPMALLIHQPGGRQSSASILVMAQATTGGGEGAVQSAMINVLEQMTGPGQPFGIGTERIGGHTFRVVESSTAAPDGAGTRRVYGTELRGYGVIFLTSFTTQDEAVAVRQALEQLRIGVR